ncbi:hypothetical protein PINS_up005660 [Pythium insidiosum]|nr:hypothetical protein PINS_up005660 [Pythium insidiosum]
MTVDDSGVVSVSSSTPRVRAVSKPKQLSLSSSSASDDDKIKSHLHAMLSSSSSSSSSSTTPRSTAHSDSSLTVRVVSPTASASSASSSIVVVVDSNADVDHKLKDAKMDATIATTITKRDGDTITATTTATKTAYVSSSTVAFWLSLWFVQNVGVTFWNKKALTALRLPVTLTFVHMVCNALGAFLYVHVFKRVERQPLAPRQQSLMASFSLVFVSNIVTGNWSLGLVSITFNQVMRALVPGVVVVLSALVLRKRYSAARKAALVPVAYGVFLACSGDNSATPLGVAITLVAVVLAALKAVLSNKFLSGELKLHPVDLILHQAPLSALWCLLAMVVTGECGVLLQHWHELPALSGWYIVTGIVSFFLNVTSFYANKVTSAVTLSVCANVKQILVIALSIALYDHEAVTLQRVVGIVLVTLGGAAYAYVSNREMHQATAPAPLVRPKASPLTV